MVLPNFVTSALLGEPLRVHGSGDQSRCFAHVYDVVEAIMRLLNTRSAVGHVFNIGNDSEITIADLAQTVRETVGSASEIHKIPYDEAARVTWYNTQDLFPGEQLQWYEGYRPFGGDHRAGRPVLEAGPIEAARLAIEAEHAGLGPERVEGLGGRAEVGGAVEAAVDEGEPDEAHTEKLLPQPQVVLAFGLRMTNCAPCRLSR